MLRTVDPATRFSLVSVYSRSRTVSTSRKRMHRGSEVTAKYDRCACTNPHVVCVDRRLQCIFLIAEKGADPMGLPTVQNRATKTPVRIVLHAEQCQRKL
jgi:hypothetical protein